MKCPVCSDVRMREVEKDGILIDVCPDCKGVWLDRGELDKLMAGVKEFRQDYEREMRSRGGSQPQGYPDRDRPAAAYNQEQRYDSDRKYEKRYDDDDDKYKQYPNQGYGHGYPKHKKKKSVFDVFEDLF
ncbi:TFIIB-type zinc ribbon-containing protein [Paenibacillus koleovorans]|uniref:TFIIB-type zinc ribbon-containing protein n=1 Tax=Paenibacillus koleovorans TaxID=121608 RepID=UPI000FDBF91D|nr:zf-TFIIB domain-containing protein [Paenibacillus koleovorans]